MYVVCPLWPEEDMGILLCLLPSASPLEQAISVNLELSALIMLEASEVLVAYHCFPQLQHVQSRLIFFSFKCGF